MRCLLHWILILAVLSGSSSTWSAAAAPLALQKLSGTVLSSEPKTPLGQTHLRVSTFPEPTFVDADDSGHFELDLPPGTWILHASAAGFADLDTKVTLKPGQGAHPVLRLEPLEFQADEFVVHGQAPPPSKAVMQMLNAPLQREPTEFEKKIAPVVNVFKIAMILTIWTLIAVGGTHK